MKYLIFCLTFIITSCQIPDSKSPEVQDLLKKLQELEESYGKLTEKLEKAITREGRIVHTVYLKLDESTGQEEVDAIMIELKKIKAIPEVQNFVSGKFYDLEDERAMSEYQVVMQMEFDSENDYTIYQNHEIHLAVRKFIGRYISRKPLIHDFIVE